MFSIHLSPLRQNIPDCKNFRLGQIFEFSLHESTIRSKFVRIFSAKFHINRNARKLTLCEMYLSSAKSLLPSTQGSRDFVFQKCLAKTAHAHAQVDLNRQQNYFFHVVAPIFLYRIYLKS